VTGITDATSDIVGNNAGFCDQLAGGSIDCWGPNDVGELGDGTSTGPETCASISCSTVPTEVSGITDSANIISDPGEGYCAVLTTAGVECWGYNADGELGDGTMIESDVPVAVVSGTTGPPANTPETPFELALPVMAVVLIGGTAWFRRRDPLR
jgi:hypothetical protein